MKLRRYFTDEIAQAKRVRPKPDAPSWKPTPLVTVALACGHTNTFDAPAPAVRQPAYCRACSKFTTVTEEIPHA